MDFIKAKEYITHKLVSELPGDLLYHGAHHTFEVVRAIEMYAEKENVEGRDLYRLFTAAYFHDSGFLFQYDDNEPLAVQLIEKVLPQFEYTSKDIEIISSIILSTASGTEPNSKLEKIMCDADHDYIGTDNYATTAKTLRKELELHDIKYTNLEWLKVQHHYLTNKHIYYTPTAIAVRQPQKEKVIKDLEKQIRLEEQALLS